MQYSVATSKGIQLTQNFPDALVMAVEASIGKKHFVAVMQCTAAGQMTPCSYKDVEIGLRGKQKPTTLTPAQVKNYLAAMSMQSVYAMAA